MSFFRNLLINANSAINQRRWLRMEADRLRMASNAGAAAVVRALDGVLRDEFSPQEREWFRTIEALRRRLLISLDRLEITEVRAWNGGRHPAGAATPEGYRPGLMVARAALGSKSAFWARVLFKLIYESQPRICLELGTNMGISAAYQASALKLIGAGRLITVEGAEPRAQMARRNLRALGLDNVQVVRGRFQETVPAVLSDCESVGFAFIDGGHNEQATKLYFDQIASHLSSPALIVLDDISWSHGMKRAWAVIQRDPRVRSVADLRVLGLCILG